MPSPTRNSTRASGLAALYEGFALRVGVLALLREREPGLEVSLLDDDELVRLAVEAIAISIDFAETGRARAGSRHGAR